MHVADSRNTKSLSECAYHSAAFWSYATIEFFSRPPWNSIKLQARPMILGTFTERAVLMHASLGLLLRLALSSLPTSK